jgi:cobalamin-dependent methionine synthase I
MLVIGENINASNNQVAEAIAKRDEEFLVNLAKSQTLAGADFIDVNTGSGHGSLQQATSDIKWLVGIIQAAIEQPLSIDSDSTDVIEAAIKEYHGETLIINSVTVEERLNACERIMSYLTGLGIKAEQVLFDPLVLPIAVDTSQGLVTLKTIEQIKSRYPDSRVVMGLSNISYGLPKRKLVNRAFLLMAACAGLDSVIVDPLDNKAMSLIKIADMLIGKDSSCRAYLRAHRKGNIID